MTGLVPLVASSSGGLRRGWQLCGQLKSLMTKCRLATVIFCFVTFVCTGLVFRVNLTFFISRLWAWFASPGLMELKNSECRADKMTVKPFMRDSLGTSEVAGWGEL